MSKTATAPFCFLLIVVLRPRIELEIIAYQATVIPFNYPRKFLPYGNTLSSQVPWDGLFTVRSMFSYGGSSGTRTHNYPVKSRVL